MNSDSGISEHRLRSSGSDDDPLVCVSNDRVSPHVVIRDERRELTRSLDKVSERSDGSELELLLRVVSGNAEHRSSENLLLVDLRDATRDKNRSEEKKEVRKKRTEDSPRGWKEWCSIEHTS